MVTRALKQPDAPLRSVIKLFKDNWDNETELRRYLPQLSWVIMQGPDPVNLPWQPEAMHRLAKAYEELGDLKSAEKYYVMAILSFPKHEQLGLARVFRDYGTFVAANYNVPKGIEIIEEAIRYHDKDILERDNAKGRRQRSITEAHLWHAQLLLSKTNAAAKRSLVTYALSECRECCIRDQSQVVEFALEFANSRQRPLLEARLTEICARRRNLPGTMKSMARFVIDMQIDMLSRVTRFVIRRV